MLEASSSVFSAINFTNGVGTLIATCKETVYLCLDCYLIICNWFKFTLQQWILTINTGYRENITENYNKKIISLPSSIKQSVEIIICLCRLAYFFVKMVFTKAKWKTYTKLRNVKKTVKKLPQILLIFFLKINQDIPALYVHIWFKSKTFKNDFPDTEKKILKYRN